MRSSNLTSARLGLKVNSIIPFLQSEAKHVKRKLTDLSNLLRHKYIINHLHPLEKKF